MEEEGREGGRERMNVVCSWLCLIFNLLFSPSLPPLFYLVSGENSLIGLDRNVLPLLLMAPV